MKKVSFQVGPKTFNTMYINFSLRRVK